MVLLNEIRGQDNAVRFLSGSLRSGRTANGYLFSGPEGVGKGLAAKAFLAELMCREKAQGTRSGACGSCSVCRRIFSAEHPDVMWISPDKNKNIKIEEIRKARDMVSLKPFEASVSACVLEDAHMMTTEASNALLKVLEEPPGKSLFILISAKRELLLPTVISRCLEVPFHSLSVEETKSVLVQIASLDDKTADFLAYFSEGSPGRALEMVESNVFTRKDELVDMIGDFFREKEPSCLNWDVETREDLLEDLELLILIFRDMGMKKAGLQDMVLDKRAEWEDDVLSACSMDKVYRVIGMLIDLKWALKGNANAKLVAQLLPKEIVGA